MHIVRIPRRIAATLAGAAIATLAMSGIVSAATTVVVTPAHQQGWSEAATNAGGDVNFVVDASAPGGAALQLTTDGTNAARAQYMHAASGSLSSVTELSYQTKQNSGPPEAAPSYQLVVDLNGAAAGGFTTLVYEPYWNGFVVPGTWQTWDVDAGMFWSSRSFAEGTCVVTAGSGGPPFYSLAGLQAACPNAIVLGFGVNVGTYNPNYDVETDLVNFNGTTYNFQTTNEPSSKDACKKGGWQNLTDDEGDPFRNQGQCIKYVNTGR